MSAAATRDDLASVVKALTESAVVQRKWQAEYEAKAEAADRRNPGGHEGQMYERFAATARGTAFAFEVSADMISKYVGVEP